MNVHNCRKCGRIFNYVVGPYICMSCREEMDKKFTEVKEYIREHRGVGIQEVSEACEVEIGQIHQWLREERLELLEGSGIVLQCENCPTIITSGRFCAKCKKEMTMGLRNAIRKNEPVAPEPKKDPKDKERMRYL